MNNVVFVAQLFEELKNDEEFNEIVTENELKNIEIEKIKQAILLKAHELNNMGIIIPRENWNIIFKSALEMYAQRQYDYKGNLLPRPHGFAEKCVNISVIDNSPVDIPSDDLIENGEFDPHFNPYSDGNHFSL